MTPKSRSKTNFYIDLIMFVLMGALIGIGILIKYVLISGQQRWELFGQNMELTFLGLDRHQWGTIHLIIGGVLVVLLLLHLVLHWNMIKCLFKKCVEPVGKRRLLSFLSVFLFIVFAAFPLFVNPEKAPRGEGRNVLENMGVDLNDSIRIRLKKPKDIESGELDMEVERINRKDDIQVRGSMTLQDVSTTYRVELKTLKRELGLPDHVSSADRLGVLRKEYGFSMGDVKTVILQHGKQ